jgi:hypothetical protein
MLGEKVRILRQIGVWVLLAVSSLTPAMACVLPGAQLTAEERACCRTMHEQCGQMDMPGSHSCCHKAAPSAYDSAPVTKVDTHHLFSASIIWITVSDLPNVGSSSIERIEQHDYSPPQSPPSAISILRI